MKKPLKVPDYFKDLPDDAKINSRDMSDIFGYKNINNITHSYQHNRIPKPDYKERSRLTGIFHSYWKVKTIREWIENANK